MVKFIPTLGRSGEDFLLLYQIFVLMSKKNNNQQNQQTADSKDFIEMEGEVVELMPATSFKVKLDNGHEILAHLSGKMRMNKIKLLLGDRVKVQMSPYDLTRGRIVYRL